MRPNPMASKSPDMAPERRCLWRLPADELGIGDDIVIGVVEG